MNLWSTINIVLNAMTLINLVITIIICLFIILLVIFLRRQIHTVPLILACHTCLTLLASAVILASMITSSLFGFMHTNTELNKDTIWCRWRGFLVHGFLCALYDSYVLQATYRFCRVVLYRHKNLFHFPLYCVYILIISSFSLISISPVFIRGDVIYLSTEYYCQTPFTNIHAILYIAIRLFFIPIALIAIIYVCLLRYIRQRNLFLYRHRRTKCTRRNLVVIRRLLLMLTVLILLGFPSVIFLIIFIFTGYLVSLTYRIGWLSVSFSLVFLAYMLIQLTRPLRKTMRRIFRCDMS